MISYAQNREDVLLERVFREREHGFYVDVGAFDPTSGSVTRHFYDKGWRGINLEPGLVFERLGAERPRDLNLNVAVSDHSGLVAFYEHPADPGTSTLAADLDPALAHCRATRICRYVPAVTLRQVFEQARPPQIDFLKIDVEGHERQVLLGNDWERFRPRVLVIEATLPYSNVPCHERWEDVILQAGYLFAHFDGLNRYYVRREDAALLERFAWPVNVLDQYVAVETVHAQEEARHLRRELEATHHRLEEEIQRLKAVAQEHEANVQRVSGEAGRLQSELQLARDQLASAGTERQTYQARLELLNSEVHRWSVEAEQLRSLHQQTQSRLAVAEQEWGKSRAEADRLDSEVRRLEALIRQRDVEVGQLQGQVQGLTSTLSYFAEVVRQYDAERRQSVLATPQASPQRDLDDQPQKPQDRLCHRRKPFVRRLGLRPAHLLDWLRQFINLRSVWVRSLEAGSAVVAAVPGRAGIGRTRNRFGRKPMKQILKAALRPFYRLFKRLGRPLTWRLREFFVRPVLTDLHALPALGLQLQEQLQQLAQRHHDDLVQQLAGLQGQQALLQQSVQQLAEALGQLREQQGQVLSQLHSQQSFIRETDRLLLALLKTAQFVPPEQPAADHREEREGSLTVRAA